jgi:hypothetical protein
MTGKNSVVVWVRNSPDVEVTTVKHHAIPLVETCCYGYISTTGRSEYGHREGTVMHNSSDTAMMVCCAKLQRAKHSFETSSTAAAMAVQNLYKTYTLSLRNY